MASEPLPAATVVVVREVQSPFEVLMVKRNDKVAFMAGAYVFPGGRVDAADTDHHIEDTQEDRFPDLTSHQEASYRRAAARELEEEAGVRVDPAMLVPFAHWVTPAVETRRYDTRFFVTRMPEGQQARHDASETTEFTWLTPAHAIQRCDAGEIMLPPPTWITLKQLAKLSSAQAVFDWARATRIVRIQPNLIHHDNRKMLTIPGDPTYPSIEGWDVPEDTRFVFEEGRGWRPTRP